MFHLARVLLRLGVWAARSVAVLAVLALVTAAPRDAVLFPAAGGAHRIWLIDHGYHSGIIVARADLVALAGSSGDPELADRLFWIASRTPDAAFLEIGWGDRAFYQATPGVTDIDPWLAVRALFWPTDAVLQIVPIWNQPGDAFRGSDMIALDVSAEGFAGLSARLAKTVARKGERMGLGPSLYGAGAFYPASLDYHLFRTCNHWAAWVLRGAGVPASPGPATLSATLRWEINWRR